MITRNREEPLTESFILAAVTEHDQSLERLTGLYDYFLGNHDIETRERTTGLPNYMLVHGYPRYIAMMTSGYLVGNPVSYSYPDNEDALNQILAAYDEADVQSVDNEIALHAAIFGRAVELCYSDDKASPRVAALDPTNAFVVYDDTVQHKPIFGVHRIVSTYNGVSSTSYITVYTETEQIEFSVSGGNAVITETSRKPHNFGDVTMVEYWNNSVEQGDFECVISLIDAYDLLQSDRINDKAQFTDALLVLTGVQGFDAPIDGDTRTAGERLREDKTLALPLEGAKAEWLTKTLNEADTDILRRSIRTDIHKFAMVPDLTDENFAGNVSGVAMKFKLFGLEQLTKVKERWFREGLRQRLRLFAGFLSLKGAATIEPNKVAMTFTRSLPVNEMEIAQMVATLKGTVPDQMLLAQIPFVQDVEAAMDMLTKQKEESVRQQQLMFGEYPDANKDKQNKESEEEAEDEGQD